MKRQYHCETRSIAPEQIETLVVSLGDRVRLLDYDIGAEEERTRCKDRRDAAYSILARTLVARRDNLSATIASLQERVATSAADGIDFRPLGQRCRCRLNATEALVFFGSCGLLIKLARPALPCCCSAHNCIVDG